VADQLFKSGSGTASPAAFFEVGHGASAAAPTPGNRRTKKPDQAHESKGKGTGNQEQHDDVLNDHFRL